MHGRKISRSYDLLFADSESGNSISPARALDKWTSGGKQADQSSVYQAQQCYVCAKLISEIKNVNCLQLRTANQGKGNELPCYYDLGWFFV